MINLNTIWENNGKPKNKAPSQWRRSMKGVEGIVLGSGSSGRELMVETQELADQYTEWLNKGITNRSFAAFEHGALCAIEQLLGITLIRQYQVGSHRIDGYCAETNTAYEVDEPQHFINGRLRQECIDRQVFIEQEIGCSFVRIKV